MVRLIWFRELRHGVEEGILRAFELDYEAVKVLTEALAGSGKPVLVSSSPISLYDTGDRPADGSKPVNRTTGRAKIDRVALDAAKENVRSVVLRVPLFPMIRRYRLFWAGKRLAISQKSALR